MKIITISDTHGFHKLIPKSWLRKADTIIHSGDITSAGYIEEIKNFLVWFDKLDYDNKIFIQHVNYINAATCNERYEIVNEPILIEI